MAETNGKGDKKEMEGQILDPLQTATSTSSDWTMISDASIEKTGHGQALMDDQTGGDSKDQKYDCKSLYRDSGWGLSAVFFYGTLLVPAILVRVLGRDCSDLQFQDALLPVGLGVEASSRNY
jgi:hypothetical protein